MDELLALIAELAAAEDDDDTVIVCKSVTNRAPAFSIGLEISTFVGEKKTRNVTIACEEVFAYSLKEDVASGIQLTGNHPLLWRFQQDSASAFFRGAPPDPYAAIGAIYAAHRRATGNWIGLETHLNDEIELSDLLSGGHGLLAKGPISLLMSYKQALGRYGVEVEICSPWPPGGWHKSQDAQRRLRAETKALLLGNSYIVGIGWVLR